ncbi:adenosinetriphosphatase [Anaerobutyricum hallii]|uniref:Adenosinetriphosphatase n=1 Tax=Anaerobutyricum hallii TaxID=39488 RepID=A0A285PQD1_9FIRM|nr:ABC transporter ATP-binding protein [Anaerobutyricum hallii]SOB71366.1 adenosinetriphosphatase [Anaerobutyricum hallii]
MASLSLRHLSKTYDNGVNAIKDVTLEVDDKEFMVLAGSMGCGISTVLRMIAGVEDITDGELLVDGERMNETPSIDRDMAMIFKNGKLYPQMNIYDNLAFGLKLKELPIGEIDARIAEVTQVLNIGHLLDKMTEDLDEKERALVVLGRAIVKKPKVFLLDEPFSSLSKELKKEMQELLWSLYEKMQITVVYVTHNSEDIRHTDTRVAVMNDGSVQQIGTIGELYDNPATPYVSEFLGVAVEEVC